MIRVPITQARARLSYLVQCSLNGERVIITRRGRDVVALEPCSHRPQTPTSVRGVRSGRSRIEDAFDALPADIEAELP